MESPVSFVHPNIILLHGNVHRKLIRKWSLFRMARTERRVDKSIVLPPKPLYPLLWGKVLWGKSQWGEALSGKAPTRCR